MDQKAGPANEFRRSMRHVAASVCVVAGHGREGRVGITATSVCSVSMTPPLLLVCINSGSSSHDALVGAGHFSVNVLDESQHALAELFAGRSRHARQERFEAAGAPWDEGPQQVPMLRDAVASLACRVVQRVPAGTHTIVIGEVLEARCAEERRPLIYMEGGYHAVGAGPRPHTPCCA
jgi:flavin reductase